MSIRIGLAGSNNPNVMVSKLEVRLRRLYFLHMARNTILSSYFAGNYRGLGRRLQYFRSLRLSSMARQTLVIIISNILFDRLMWIVASGATNAQVVGVTLAVKDPVRLKPNVINLQTS